MKLILDMNIPLSWVEFLESHGIDAIHWRNVGNIKAEDTEIMEWARRNEVIVFTHWNSGPPQRGNAQQNAQRQAYKL